MKSSRKKHDDPIYESAVDTSAAIERIHHHFERAKKSRAREKAREASPEGVLRSTLQALLTARKAMDVARKNLDHSIAALRRSLPRK